MDHNSGMEGRMSRQSNECFPCRACRSVTCTVIAVVGIVSAYAQTDVPQPEMKWEKLAPLPDSIGVAGPFAGVTGDALVVAGGANFPEKPLWEGGKRVWHAEAYVLPDAHGKWQTGFKLPRALAYGVSISRSATKRD